MKIKVKSIFQCSPETIWHQVQKIAVLLEIASPLLKFKYKDNKNLPTHWEINKEYIFNLYLFGVLPLGKHVILVRKIDNDLREIQSQEHGTLAKTWNHIINIKNENNYVIYSDEIEVKAGPLTIPIWCFAYIFYSHRQWKLAKIIQNVRS